jgi:hypothetical protein
MHEKNELIVSLLYKSTDNQALTEAEQYDLEQWLSSSEHNVSLYNEVMDLPAMKAEIQAVLKNYDSEAEWRKIWSQIKGMTPISTDYD